MATGAISVAPMVEFPDLDVVEPVVDHVRTRLPRAPPAPAPDGRAELRFMPGTEVPVIRQPFEPGDLLPFWAAMAAPVTSCLFDVDVDPGELENQAGGRQEAELADALAVELRRIEAPSDVLERIGLA